MSKIEERLKQSLFPRKPLNVETVEQDILHPLNQLITGLNEVRERIGLDLFKEAVELASDVEVQRRSEQVAVALKDVTQQINVVMGLREDYASLAGKVEDLATKIAAYVTQAQANTELEREVLLKLSAYLDR